MAEVNSKERISVSKEEYLRLKTLEKRFQEFWHYIERLIDVREARKEIEQGKIVPQEQLFKELGF